MNFSNPKPIQKSGAKVNPLLAWIEKGWAGLSMISLMVPGTNTREGMPGKNIGVLIFVFIVVYLGACGVYINYKWLRGISISGEWFYYVGYLLVFFLCIELFNITKRVREFALQKKIIFVNRDSLLERLIGRSKLYNVFATLMGITSFVWVVMGIIFYERHLFIALFCTIIIFAIITNFQKKIEVARIIFKIELITTILFLLYILTSHF